MSGITDRQCYDCGGRLRRDVRSEVVRYLWVTVDYDAPGWYCDGCGAIFRVDKDKQAREEAIRVAKVRASTAETKQK
jgi:hypothetical protein